VKLAVNLSEVDEVESGNIGGVEASGDISCSCKRSKTKVKINSCPAQFLVCLVGALEAAGY
jgi:hypothetical protein